MMVGWVFFFPEVLTFARKAARKENSDDNNSFRINQLGMVYVMLCCVLCGPRVLCCPPSGFCADVWTVGLGKTTGKWGEEKGKKMGEGGQKGGKRGEGKRGERGKKEEKWGKGEEKEENGNKESKGEEVEKG